MERPTIIEIARKARGWTQTQLANAASTSQATVSAYERREKSPSLKVIERAIGEAGYTLRLDHTVDFNKFFDGQTLYRWVQRFTPLLIEAAVLYRIDDAAHRVTVVGVFGRAEAYRTS